MTVTMTRPSSRYSWVPAVAGWTVGVIATLSLIASVSPWARWLIKVPREFVNDYIFNFPDTSFAWAFVLALLGAALAARKRIAWWILLLYMVAAIGWNIGGLVTGEESWVEDVGEMIGLAFHLAAIAFLVLARNQFWAKVRRGALFRAAAVLVAGMAVGIVVAWGLLEVFPGTLHDRQDRLAYAINRVSGFATLSSNSFDGEHASALLNAVFGLFGALALIAATVVLFLSQRADNALTGEDESAIRGLLELFGKNDSLGYFATRRDKAVIFAPNGRAAITYRVEVGVCLASGDPVGDPKAWPAAIDAWLHQCEEYGWAPGVMGASTAGAEAFRSAGLNALQLGDEAILYPDSFRLSGPDMRAVRQAVTRARRAGLSVRIRRHRDIPEAEMADVIKHADSWRDTETERGFSMALGRLGDPADGDCVLVEAVREADDEADDDVVAMLSLVPWGTSGVSLDLMRRSPQSPNGTIELMVSELTMRSETIGVSRISLNFAMFRSSFEQGAQLGAGVLLALVAAGDPVPLEHEVPAAVGAALRLLRGRPAHPAGGRRVGDRRRLSGAAVLEPRQVAAHRTPPGGAAEHRGDRPAARRRIRARRQRPAGRPRRRRRRPPPARAGSRPDGEAEITAGRRNRRLPGGKSAQPHHFAGHRRRTRHRGDSRRPGAADPRLRRGALRRPARLVRRSATAVRQFAARGGQHRRLHRRD